MRMALLDYPLYGAHELAGCTIALADLYINFLMVSYLSTLLHALHPRGSSELGITLGFVWEFGLGGKREGKERLWGLL